MSLLYYFKRLYSLDTLDTRFTTTAKTPLQETAKQHGVNGDAASSRPTRSADEVSIPGTRPSKWQTWEYYFYYLVFLTIVPLMFWVPYTVSRESDPEYPKFAPLLSNGWIPGRKVDNSDAQYASFRDNIPYMALLVILHPLLRKAYELLRPSRVSEQAKSEIKADDRMQRRIRFDLGFALCFLLVLHGFSAIKVLLILYINFLIPKRLPRSMIPPATWIFNIAILFSNELCHGYPYSDLARLVSVAPFNPGTSPSASWATWLDAYGGLIPRWEILFNITVLRLISFNLDYYWSLDRRAVSPVEKQLNPENMSERDRVSQPPSPATFDFTNYLAYALYSPLYLAGPIITFNDYISQLRYPSPSITRSRTILYGIRFLLTLLTMELVLHYIYAVAISKSNPNWSHYTPFQLSMLGYFNLHIIWMKLLLPWRFFRLWSLLDGIDPPENMVRCMSDNYSALAFWRGWHRSFNRWIVRYIFVPLGGTGRGLSIFRSLFNLLAVFTFVALWHDISLRLLTWSWLIVLFLLPEIVCSKVLFPAKAYKSRPETYRILSGIGAVGTVMMMMAANLVGFAVGLDGLQEMVRGIVSGWEGWAFLGAASATLFVGVMVMFELREHEKRNGIVMTC